MKVVGFIFLAIVIFAIRVGVRMAFRAGSNAAFGNDAQRPTCPYCSSSNVTQQGGHWDCNACQQMF
jgi:ribosomal protein L37AE/L43A